MFTRIQNRIYLNVPVGKSALDVPQLPVNPSNSNRSHITATRRDGNTRLEAFVFLYTNYFHFCLTNMS